MNVYIAERTKFKVGDTAKARAVRGYEDRLTVDGLYEVTDVQPSQYLPAVPYTFPEYVTVVDDRGRPTECRAERFDLVSVSKSV